MEVSMAKAKADIRVDSRSVRKKVQRSGGRPSHIDRPATATGRRARRIAAKEQGVSGEINRDDSRDKKKATTAKPSGQRNKQRKAA
jgi:hypothetical protein